MRVLLIILIYLFYGACYAAESVSTTLSVTIPPFLSIKPLTSTVLTAHVRDQKVQNPLYVKYKVVSNIPETTIFLTACSLVEGNLEHSMFQNGQVYVAFSNINQKATLQDMSNAKIALNAPNILVLPILNVSGAEHKFLHDRYELYIKNGIYNIDVNIGLNSPRRSADGIYQATMFLTKVEI